MHSHFQRLPLEKLEEATKAFWQMEEMGLCQKTSSPWASPLHFVRKNGSTWRPWGDYCCFSMITKPDHYLLPNIADVTSNLHRARIFSKLNLLKCYYQVPVNPADFPKMSIIMPFGTYTFNYYCFGLHKSSITFQWFTPLW